MPWDAVTLNDGHIMPSIAFGTWTLGNGKNAIEQVEQGLDTGFSHVDTAQIYRNEAEAGQAIKESGLSRSEIFVTTKWSAMDGLDVPTSIRNSVKNLGLDYVDLYLVHNPRIAQPNIATVWAQMEKVREDGLAKSIGISNFNAVQITELLANAKIKPAVNQILFHPYVHVQQAPTVAAAKAAGIIVEAYSSLTPITRQPGGPLDAPLHAIASRLNASTDQVLMAWNKAKGVVPVTTSSKRSRLEGYLSAADLPLTPSDIAEIDYAGAKGETGDAKMNFVRRVGVLALVAAVALGACAYLGIDIV